MVSRDEALMHATVAANAAASNRREIKYCLCRHLELHVDTAIQSWGTTRKRFEHLEGGNWQNGSWLTGSQNPKH